MSTDNKATDKEKLTSAGYKLCVALFTCWPDELETEEARAISKNFCIEYTRMVNGLIDTAKEL